MPNRVKITLYPNNEVRAIIGRESKRRDDRDPPCAGPDNVGHDGDRGGGDPLDWPLDITSKLSVGLPPGFGGTPRQTRFGNNARRTISRAAGVFEADGLYPDEFVLLTGTIPGSTRAAFDAIACWSSWIVKAVKTWISDSGCRAAYSLYVWEFQRRGALHLHYCLHCPDVMMKVGLLRSWKRKWTEIIDSVSEKSGVDCWERKRGGTWATNKKVLQADAQVIRRSVGGYLADYLSKNAPEPGNVESSRSRNLGPVRWWGVSRPLLARLSQLTESFTIDAIAHQRVREITEEIYDRLNWSENRVYSYWDKARSTNVLLTYSPQECQAIYSYLRRDLCHTKTAISVGSNECSQMISTSTDFDRFLSRENDLLRQTAGVSPVVRTSPCSRSSWSATPVDTSVQLKLQWR